jgi:hypothetical protein
MSRGPSWPLVPLGRSRRTVLDTTTSVMAVTVPAGRGDRLATYSPCLVPQCDPHRGLGRVLPRPQQSVISTTIRGCVTIRRRIDLPQIQNSFMKLGDSHTPETRCDNEDHECIKTGQHKGISRGIGKCDIRRIGMFWSDRTAGSTHDQLDHPPAAATSPARQPPLSHRVSGSDAVMVVSTVDITATVEASARAFARSKSVACQAERAAP